MGCFLGCFGAAEDRTRRKQRQNIQPRDHLQRTPRNNPEPSTVSLAQDFQEKPITPVKESSGKPEETLSSASKKKVTFNTNVKTYEHAWPDESIDFSLEKKEEEEETRMNTEDLMKPTLSQSCSDENISVTSSSGSYPPNHRYQNCRESDDEESELDDDDYDDDEDGGVLDDQDDDWYYDDMSYGVKRVYTEALEEEEEGCKGMKAVGRNGGARDRSGYVHAVLNPVENLSQWKAIKEKGKAPPPLKPQKENLSLDEEAQMPFNLKESPFIFKPRSDHHHQPEKSSLQEVAVDASLSTWLSSTETTPMSKNSSVNFQASTPGSNSIRSQEERPILGALTLEEIRQFSASSVSPKRSPSKSPDERPIIGTVGTYWNHSESSGMDPASASSFKGIPNTTSKFREDRRVNWHSTPFETRLERALERGAAAASSNVHVLKKDY